MVKIKKDMIGRWAFLIGVGGALLLGLLAGLGLFQASAWMYTVLVIAGLLIGLLNVTMKEAVPFMVAVLVIGGSAGILSAIPIFGQLVETIFTSVASLALPVAIPVALMTAYKKVKR